MGWRLVHTVALYAMNITQYLITGWYKGHITWYHEPSMCWFVFVLRTYHELIVNSVTRLTRFKMGWRPVNTLHEASEATNSNTLYRSLEIKAISLARVGCFCSTYNELVVNSVTGLIRFTVCPHREIKMGWRLMNTLHETSEATRSNTPIAQFRDQGYFWYSQLVQRSHNMISWAQHVLVVFVLCTYHEIP